MHLTDELENIGKYIEAQCAHHHIPGLSVVVVHEQAPLWLKSWGFADLEQQIPATTGTIYRICSVTKMFTATMLMHLCEQGNLQLDDPVAMQVPEVSRLSQEVPITYRHLVSHTSGLPMMPPTIDQFLPRPFAEGLTHEDLPHIRYPTIHDILASLAETTLLSPPGTRVQYSNFGVALLAHALETLIGQPYKEYVAQYILRPLAMHSTSFQLTDELGKRQAKGYYAWDTKTPQLVPDHDLDGFAPAGGLFSSVSDMARFIALHLSDRRGTTDSILSSQTVAQMRKPILVTAKPRYMDEGSGGGVATGWFLSSVAGFPVVEHGGGDFPYSTFLALVPSLGLGVFIATNTGSETQAVAQMAYATLASLTKFWRGTSLVK